MRTEYWRLVTMAQSFFYGGWGLGVKGLGIRYCPNPQSLIPNPNKNTMQNRITSHKRIIAILLAVVALASLAGVGYLATEPSFTIYDEDEPVMVSGRYTTVGDVLAAAEISVRDADIVQPGLGETAVSDTAIQIQRARSVTVKTDAGTQTYWTQQTTLSAFLFEINNMPGRTDQVTADGRSIPFAALGSIAPYPPKSRLGAF